LPLDPLPPWCWHGCLERRRYKAIDWRILTIIFGMLGDQHRDGNKVGFG